MSECDRNADISGDAAIMITPTALTGIRECVSRVPLNKTKSKRKLVVLICMWVVNIEFVVASMFILQYVLQVGMINGTEVFA